MSDIAIEQRISSFFRRFVEIFLLVEFVLKFSLNFRIPSSIRPRDYDRSSVIRLIHECLGLPASPPATSEDSEVDSDSPPRSTNVVNQSASSTVHHSIPIQVAEPAAPAPFNPQLIRIDERTMQLHFTPLYFGKFHANQIDRFVSMTKESSLRAVKFVSFFIEGHPIGHEQIF